MNSDTIMRRFMELSPGTKIGFRDTFPDTHPSRWYVAFDGVVYSTPRGGTVSYVGEGGTTPEAALDNQWNAILRTFENPEWFAIRYIAETGKEQVRECPQAWVRWDSTQDTWVDVVPTDSALANHGIKKERVLSYKNHIFWDRYP